MTSKIKSYFKKITKVPENRRNIEIYRITGNIKTQLLNCDNMFSNSGIGNFIIIIDDTVWIEDWNDLTKEQFAQTTYGSEFIRVNTTLFEKIR